MRIWGNVRHVRRNYTPKFELDWNSYNRERATFLRGTKTYGSPFTISKRKELARFSR